MKRDWDVTREILLRCEAAPPGPRIGPDAFPALDEAVVFEHVRILTEAGYLEARLLPSHNRRLTRTMQSARRIFQAFESRRPRSMLCSPVVGAM